MNGFGFYLCLRCGDKDGSVKSIACKFDFISVLIEVFYPG